MTKLKLKMLMVSAGIAVLLCGCTKSNIVKPDEASQAPDFNLYNDIELDVDQLHEDLNDIVLDEQDYPMASSVDFDINLDEEKVDITVVVKDGTSAEDAALYADAVIKCLNDQVALQDFSYGESDEDTFGGLYQDNVVNLKIYTKTMFEANDVPLYEAQIPKDTYMTFEIEE